MKTVYKKIIAAGTLGVMTSTLVIPPVAFAQVPAAGTQINAKICSQIDTRGQQMVQKLTEAGQKFLTNKANRMAKLSTERVSRDQLRATKRAEVDANKNQHYATLMSKADTDAKKAAVAQFQSTAQSALATRRVAVDNAIKAQRAGIDGLINGKWGTLQTVLTTFTNSVNQAFATAKSSCASGVDGKTVATKLKADLKSAHDTFKSSRIDAAIKADIDALINTRVQAVTSAETNYKTTMDAARATLKAAFK